jgi:Leucine-rich repeat (LRR) protein
MQLTTLNISGTRVTSLEPVRGMPLQELFSGGSKVNDLTPLKDAPLRLVDVSFTGVTDLSPLRAIKTLETINSQPAAEFWKNAK